MECTICLELLSDTAVSTICGHIYCSICIDPIIQSSGSCPICCHKLTAKDIHRVYLPYGNEQEAGKMDLQIVKTRIDDLQREGKQQTDKLTEMETMMNSICENFSRIDSESMRNQKLQAKVNALETNINDLQAKLQHWEQIVKKTIVDQSEAQEEEEKEEAPAVPLTATEELVKMLKK